MSILTTTVPDFTGAANITNGKLASVLSDHASAIETMNTAQAAALQAAIDVAAGNTAIAKKTVTVGEAALSGASQAVNIGTALPANAVVLAHEIVVNTQGVLAGNDLTITVGGTTANAIVASTDLDALAAGKYQGTLGTHPRGSFSAEQLVATFAASNLASLSAGNWTITVWYIVLA